MKLKLKYLTIALAAGALVAVLGLPDLADARGGGGGGRRRRGFRGRRPWRFRRRHVAAAWACAGAPLAVAMGMRGRRCAMSFWRHGECGPDTATETIGVPHGSRFYGQSSRQELAYREPKLQQKLFGGPQLNGRQQGSDRQYREEPLASPRPEKYDRHQEQSAGLEQIAAGGGAHQAKCLL